eukprot:2836741-Rhodomonas_salina.2
MRPRGQSSVLGCAVPGTESVQWYGPVVPVSSSLGRGSAERQAGALSSYALATRCPYQANPRGSITLRKCYPLPGTDVSYAAVAAYGFASEGLEFNDDRKYKDFLDHALATKVISPAVSGTNAGYGATEGQRETQAASALARPRAREPRRARTVPKKKKTPLSAYAVAMRCPVVGSTDAAICYAPSTDVGYGPKAEKDVA